MAFLGEFAPDFAAVTCGWLYAEDAGFGSRERASPELGIFFELRVFDLFLERLECQFVFGFGVRHGWIVTESARLSGMRCERCGAGRFR